MHTRPLPKFDDAYYRLPESIRKKVDRQLHYLLQDLTHPSLHAKKYHETDGIWQARIDRRYRFYFKIENDAYILLSIKRHTD